MITLGEMWGPRVFKGWPSCFSHNDLSTAAEMKSLPTKIVLPPKRVYQNNGYLMVSCNGGFNQMRAAICDMVTVARYLNVTLIVPELDKTSFWNDPSEFDDIFDVDHFISSLRDVVRILRELPPRLKKRVELGMYHAMPPISWSNMSYYQNQVNFPSLICLFEIDNGFGGGESRPTKKLEKKKSNVLLEGYVVDVAANDGDRNDLKRARV